jgi:hypothetical protein
VQNDVDEELLVEKFDFKIKGEDEGSAVDPSGSEDVGPVERTVFVNAANYPSGKMAWRGTHRVPFAGPGFQPVVVDLKDAHVPLSGL